VRTSPLDLVQVIGAEGAAAVEKGDGNFRLGDSAFRVRIVPIGAGEKSVDCYVIDGPICDDEVGASKEEIAEKSVLSIIEVLSVVGIAISHSYAKYFVSNCIISSGDKIFGDKEAKAKAKETCLKYVEENLKQKDPPKDLVKDYLDNFPLRPFTGDAINKLPKMNGDMADWDELYINTALTKKELQIE